MAFTGVRKGTPVWVAEATLNPAVNGGACYGPGGDREGLGEGKCANSPPVGPPHAGGQNRARNPAAELASPPPLAGRQNRARIPTAELASPLPLAGGIGGGFVPIESLYPGDFVLARDGRLHRVQRVIRQRYSGLLVGIRHEQSSIPVWLAESHCVLAIPRPRSLGGHADWSATPISHLQSRKRLRREMTPPERILWQLLRRKQLGVKFRRQHPIGPYIADFYSRDARLIVEVDGAAHDGDAAQPFASTKRRRSTTWKSRRPTAF
jgi:hypothetical protein